MEGNAMFQPATYKKRRTQLCSDLDSGIALFPGNTESPMNYTDNPYPFRQDSSFLYFFGLDTPCLAGIVDLDEHRSIIFGDDPTLDDIIWMGPQTPLAEKCTEAGITETMPFKQLDEFLRKARRSGRHIHFLPPYRGETKLLLQQILGIDGNTVVEHSSVPLIRAVVKQRERKSEEEIGEIEAAVDLCRTMQVTAMKTARPGVFEREVVGAMEGAVIARGVHISFPTILSIHGETLHNHHHHNRMEKGNIVINDSGAESPLHYAGDITRTIPVQGTFTGRQREIYTIVLRAQEKAMDAVKPGTRFLDIHLLACTELAEGLKELGLMKGDTGEAVEAGAHALFFQCGLGHMMGLDVHDMEDLGEDLVGYTETLQKSPEFGLRSLRLGKQLQAGFVVTVEPGLYFIPQLIDRWNAEKRHAAFINYDKVNRYRDFGGVRLEDDVLVTDTGSRLLGKPIPKAIIEVEELASQ